MTLFATYPYIYKDHPSIFATQIKMINYSTVNKTYRTTYHCIIAHIVYINNELRLLSRRLHYATTVP